MKNSSFIRVILMLIVHLLNTPVLLLHYFRSLFQTRPYRFRPWNRTAYILQASCASMCPRHCLLGCMCLAFVWNREAYSLSWHRRFGLLSSHDILSIHGDKKTPPKRGSISRELDYLLLRSTIDRVRQSNQHRQPQNQHLNQLPAHHQLAYLHQVH